MDSVYLLSVFLKSCCIVNNNSYPANIREMAQGEAISLIKELSDLLASGGPIPQVIGPHDSGNANSNSFIVENRTHNEFDGLEEVG